MVVVPTIAVAVGEHVLNLAHVAFLASQSSEGSGYPTTLAVGIDSLNANVILNAILESIKSDGLLGNSTSICPSLIGSLLVLYAPRGLVSTSLPSCNSTVSANLVNLQVLWLVVNYTTAGNILESSLGQEVASVHVNSSDVTVAVTLDSSSSSGSSSETCTLVGALLYLMNSDEQVSTFIGEVISKLQLNCFASTIEWSLPNEGCSR